MHVCVLSMDYSQFATKNTNCSVCIMMIGSILVATITLSEAYYCLFGVHMYMKWFHTVPQPPMVCRAMDWEEEEEEEGWTLRSL